MLTDKPWFRWRGNIYPALKNSVSWVLGCPICGDGVPCRGIPRDEMTLPHTVTMAEDGALTITPSVVCPRNCGWHVYITNGEATDC